MKQFEQILTGALLVILILLLLIPLYHLHSKLVDGLAQLSAQSATAIFKYFGLK